MKNMDKIGEFDFDLAQSILKSNSKKKSGKMDVEEEQITSLEPDTGNSKLGTRNKNWAQGDRGSCLQCRVSGCPSVYRVECPVSGVL